MVTCLNSSDQPTWSMNFVCIFDPECLDALESDPGLQGYRDRAYLFSPDLHFLFDEADTERQALSSMANIFAELSSRLSKGELRFEIICISGPLKGCFVSN